MARQEPKFWPVDALVTEIRAYCAEHADPANAGRYARYFKEGYDAWGLLGNDHPIWTVQEPEWLERFGEFGLDFFFAVGAELLRSGKYEEGALAIRFLKSYRAQVDEKHLPCLARWFEAGIRNWAHTDVLAGEVLAPLIVRKQISYTALAAWRDSPLRFQRRIVPVSMLGLVKKREEHPVTPLVEFLRPLMLDEQRVVQQGLGWFLREAWKKDPQAVEKLLTEFKERAPRTIYQYATEKMTAEQKARFRRAKK